MSPELLEGVSTPKVQFLLHSSYEDMNKLILNLEMLSNYSIIEKKSEVKVQKIGLMVTDGLFVFRNC